MKYKILIVGYDFRLKEYRYNQPVETPEGYFLNSSADVLFTLYFGFLIGLFSYTFIYTLGIFIKEEHLSMK